MGSARVGKVDKLRLESPPALSVQMETTSEESPPRLQCEFNVTRHGSHVFSFDWAYLHDAGAKRGF